MGNQYSNNKRMLCYDAPVYVGFADDFHELFETTERDMLWLYDLENTGPFPEPVGKMDQYIAVM